MNAVGEKRLSAPKRARERFLDSRGVAFDEYPLLPPLDGKPVRDWPTVKRVVDPTVCREMHKRFGAGGCWNCQAKHAQAHHLAAGSAGRSDEYTVIVMLCKNCHSKVNTPELPLERLLGLKWLRDRANVCWVRLALLFRRLLPTPKPKR